VTLLSLCLSWNKTIFCYSSFSVLKSSGWAEWFSVHIKNCFQNNWFKKEEGDSKLWWVTIKTVFRAKQSRKTLPFQFYWAIDCWAAYCNLINISIKYTKKSIRVVQIWAGTISQLFARNRCKTSASFKWKIALISSKWHQYCPSVNLCPQLGPTEVKNKSFKRIHAGNKTILYVWELKDIQNKALMKMVS
jgi:hypothetical protein